MTKEIKFGENIIQVRATALTLLFYRQEFKRDMLGDFLSMENLRKGAANYDGLLWLQLLWALNKTEVVSENLGKSFPSFQNWIGQLKRIDFAGEFTEDLSDIIADGFFRGNEEDTDAGTNK